MLTPHEQSLIDSLKPDDYPDSGDRFLVRMIQIAAQRPDNDENVRRMLSKLPEVGYRLVGGPLDGQRVRASVVGQPPRERIAMHYVSPRPLASYFSPFGATDMLDAPIRVCEYILHRGPNGMAEYRWVAEDTEQP